MTTDHEPTYPVSDGARAFQAGDNHTEGDYIEHPTFTDQTWADLGNYGLRADGTWNMSWERSHDLAVEAYETTREFCPLAFEDWRTLVSAVSSGLPVILTWGRDGTRTTQTVMVDSVMTLAAGTVSNIYIRTWGFAFPLGLRDLHKVEAPQAIYTHRKEDS